MSKTKMLLWAAMWVGIAILFLFWHAYACTFVLLLIACPFAVIASLKHRRDRRIIHEAEEVHHLAARLPAVKPPMSSQGNDRLFVPPPLQH